MFIYSKSIIQYVVKTLKVALKVAVCHANAATKNKLIISDLDACNLFAKKSPRMSEHEASES